MCVDRIQHAKQYFDNDCCMQFHLLHLHPFNTQLIFAQFCGFVTLWLQLSYCCFYKGSRPIQIKEAFSLLSNPRKITVSLFGWFVAMSHAYDNAALQEPLQDQVSRYWHASLISYQNNNIMFCLYTQVWLVWKSTDIPPLLRHFKLFCIVCNCVFSSSKRYLPFGNPSLISFFLLNVFVLVSDPFFMMGGGGTFCSASRCLMVKTQTSFAAPGYYSASLFNGHHIPRLSFLFSLAKPFFLDVSLVRNNPQKGPNMPFRGLFLPSSRVLISPCF